jgi:hypothetical protein
MKPRLKGRYKRLEVWKNNNEFKEFQNILTKKLHFVRIRRRKISLSSDNGMGLFS